MIEVLDAAHSTAFVESPYPKRGGIMIVGPPEVLKTTFVEMSFKPHPSALILSDINVQQLVKLKEDITGGRYSSFAFTDFGKLYERRGDTASNTEGMLRMLVEEGFTHGPFQDPTAMGTPARALVVGAMTETCYKLHAQAWKQSGFLRRFLWVLFSIDPIQRNKLVHAVREWKLINMDGIIRKAPVQAIPYTVTESESLLIEGMLKEQPSLGSPYVLLKKILCVLKWKYEKKEPGKAIHILKDLAPCLFSRGGKLEL